MYHSQHSNKSDEDGESGAELPVEKLILKRDVWGMRLSDTENTAIPLPLLCSVCLLLVPFFVYLLPLISAD